MPATKTSNRPAPLRDTSGRLIAKFACSAGGSFFDDGTMASGDSSPDLGRMIAACPYRAYRLRHVPGVIGSAWLVPTEAPTPPLWLLQDMAHATAAGLGLLLLATDKDALDHACAYIERLFTLAGIDAVAGVAGHRQRQPQWRSL
jgi:hypothetical protein